MKSAVPPPHSADSNTADSNAADSNAADSNAAGSNAASSQSASSTSSNAAGSRSDGSRPLVGYYLGKRPYRPILELMGELFEARKKGDIPDTILLLEHDKVITFGRGAKAKNVLAPPELLERLGVEIVETRRGGDVTLHAPGQLIAYPILDLAPDRADVRKYVQALTRVMIELVRPYGLDASPMSGKIGLWLDLESPGAWPGEENAKAPIKLGAIGVAISRWVTQHGFALNFTTDMSLFSLIVPCGIEDFPVGSVESVVGSAPSVEAIHERAFSMLASEFARGPAELVDARSLTLEELRRRLLRLSPS